LEVKIYPQVKNHWFALIALKGTGFVPDVSSTLFQKFISAATPPIAIWSGVPQTPKKLF